MATVRGISYPFRKGTSSFPEKATDDQLVKEDLFQLVMTGIGTRVMRPTFGTNIYSFIFEPNDDLLGSMVQAELQSAISKFEPRVSVVDIGVTRLDSEIIIAIAYTVNATGNTDAIDVRFAVP